MEKRNITFTHFKKNLNKAAFTLSEVLIVVAIIGVVAATVLPTLLDVGNERIWQNQSNVFGSKMFTALKLMNQRGDLAMLDSTEEFVSNLGKYIRITKTCPSETAYECFDKKMIVKSGEKPKNVQEMQIKTAENLGHDDWEGSNVMGVQFADGISALLAYNTSDCLPKVINAAENVWDSDVFNCIAMMFDVNSNGSPNEKGSDIRLVNAGGVGSVQKKCVDGSCYAFIVPTEGVDCTKTENAQKCRAFGNFYGSSDVGNSSNMFIGVALNCNELEMHLATRDELYRFVNSLGKDYFAKIAAKYGKEFFISQSYFGNGGGVDGYNNLTGNTGRMNITDLSSTNWIALCVGADN